MTHNPYIRNVPECNQGASCCCDVCTHSKITCLGDCCRCVPRWMCGVLSPDDLYATNCITWGMLLESAAGVGGYSGTFGSLFGFTDSTWTLSLERDITDPYNPVCKWVFELLDLEIREEFIIGEGYMTCQSPSLSVAIHTTYCDWTLTLDPYYLEKVPFEGPPASTGNTQAFTCGDCTEVCNVICVRYEWEGDLVRKEFTWNSYLSQWEYELGDVFDVIQIGEYAGQCYLSFAIEDFEVAGIEFADTSVDLCGIGLDIEVTSSLGEVTVGVSCNHCTCYKLHCGTCRCACSELCVVLYEDGIATLHELFWTTSGPDGGPGWINADETYFIELARDPDTNGCVLVVPEFGEFPIDDCGTGIQIELEDYLGNYGGFVLCRSCVCGLSRALCCERDRASPDFPLVLFGTITSGSGCACAGSSLPLYYRPFAGFWEGSGGIGSCQFASFIRIFVDCVADVIALRDNAIVICGDTGPEGGPYTGIPIQSGNIAVLNTAFIDCDPMQVSGEIILDRSCCSFEPMAGGTISITVTE